MNLGLYYSLCPVGLVYFCAEGLARTKGLEQNGGSAKFSPPHKTAIALLYGMQYAECSRHQHHNTQLHGLITDRSVEFTFSPLKVSENSGGAYWPRGGLKSV